MENATLLAYLGIKYMETTGLSDITGLSIASNPESPVVFLKLEKSTGSINTDLQLLQDIADRVSQLNSCFFVSHYHNVMCQILVVTLIFIPIVVPFRC